MTEPRPVFYPPAERVRVAWYAEGFGFGAAEWAEAFAGVDWRGDGPDEDRKAWVLKAGRKGTVWRATLHVGRGRRARTIEAVLKVQPLPRLGKKTQSLLHKTKAWRQRNGARLLEQKSIPCTPCHAILRGGSGRRTAEVLVAGWIEGPTLLERLAADGRTIAEEKALCAALGEQAGRMVAGPRSIWNTDHKPSNLVIQRAGSIAVIDTLDLEVGRRGSGPGGDVNSCEMAMWASLSAEPVGSGLVPRRTLAMRAARAIATACPPTNGRMRVDARRIFGVMHVHPEDVRRLRPADDPLAPPRRAFEIESAAPSRAAPKQQ